MQLAIVPFGLENLQFLKTRRCNCLCPTGERIHEFSLGICPYTIEFECNKNQWWTGTAVLSDTSIENPFFIADNEGTFEFEFFLVDEEGDSINATVSIEVQQAEELSELSAIDTLEFGETAPISSEVNFEDFISYDFSGLASDYLIEGTGEELLFSPADTGSFELILNYIDAGGCSGNKTHLFTVVPMGTGLHEIGFQNEVVFFPNPARDYFRIQIEEPEEIITVNIYGLSGDKIHSSENAYVNLPSCPSGIYLVELLFKSGKQYHSKITIQ